MIQFEFDSFAKYSGSRYVTIKEK